MKFLVVASLTLAFAACSLAGVPNVVRFQVKDPVSERVGTYSFTNCLPADKELAVVNSLVFKPDPLEFPGPLSVSFDVTVKQELNSPLKAVVYLGKKIGSGYIKIPCIGNIGSCTYDDLCALLSGISSCPQPFVKAGFNCQCPFKAANFKVPEADFTVEAAVLPPGDYHGQANLTMNGQTVGCYDIKASFS